MTTRGVTLVVKDVAVVDVEHGEVHRGRDVLIDDAGLITGIRPHEAAGRDEPNASIIDGRGRFLMPGLIDSHVHVAFNGFLDVRSDFTCTLAQHLLHGVTTVVDFFTVGGHFPGSSPETVRDDVNAGKFLGPRMLTSYGCVNAPGGFCDCSVGEAASRIATVADIERELDRITGVRPDFVKIVYDDVFGTIPNLTREQLREIVESSHRRGFKVAVHVATSAQAADATAVGADILGHGIIDDLPDALIRELADREVVVIPTLASYEARSTARWRLVLPSVSPPEVVQRYATTTRTIYEQTEQLALYGRAFERSVGNLCRMVEAGVKIVAGSDAGTWYTFPGDALLRELEIYTSAGLMPVDALRMATSSAADVWAVDSGRVAVGRQADLVMLASNPLEDVTALRYTEAVVRGGQLLDLPALAAAIIGVPGVPGTQLIDEEVPCSPHHVHGHAEVEA
jgi:imidazolonepropionase-like amidohydrolase